MSTLRIGTRGSALARAQTGWVAALLGVETEIVVLRTSGDEGVGPGDKSRWVDSLEAALLDGDVDLAVHSAKDVPGELAAGTALVAAPARADAGDVVVGELPEGARVGTTALRRRAQLLAWRPDLELVDLRGNVDTRLRKLAAGEADAIVLAAAGLARLGVDASADPLDGALFVPAPGQGILALQARSDDARARAAAASVNDDAALAALLAERAAVRVLGATCHTPVGVHADGVRVRGFAGLPDGSEWVLDEVDGSDGEALARRMLSAGAAEILARSQAMAS